MMITILQVRKLRLRNMKYLPRSIIMERNGSFVSGYLCEILPSAKEPRGDLHVTQNSSEARPNHSFSRKGTE